MKTVSCRMLGLEMGPFKKLLIFVCLKFVLISLIFDKHSMWDCLHQSAETYVPLPYTYMYL